MAVNTHMNIVLRASACGISLMLLIAAILTILHTTPHDAAYRNHTFADPQIARLWNTVGRTDRPSAAALRIYGDRAYFNPARRSLQVLCSNGSVIVNVPLTDQELALMVPATAAP